MIFEHITSDEAARRGYIHEVEDDLKELEEYTSDEEEYELYTTCRNVGDDE